MACCVSFVLRGSRVVESLLEFGQFGVVLVRFFFRFRKPRKASLVVKLLSRVQRVQRGLDERRRGSNIQGKKGEKGNESAEEEEEERGESKAVCAVLFSQNWG